MIKKYAFHFAHFVLEYIYNIFLKHVKGVFNMAKKLGKILVLTAIVGAAAGAYYYFQNKDKKPSFTPGEDDDFDDFEDMEDLDKEGNPSDQTKERSYVTLDRKVDLNAAKDTAKEVMDTVKEKMATVVSMVADVTKTSIHALEQATENLNKKEAYSEDFFPESEESDAEDNDFTENIPFADGTPLEKVEEFFDDDDDKDAENEIDQNIY